jgi:hypothetical protein
MKEPSLFDIMLGKACDLEILQERNGVSMRLCLQDIQIDYKSRRIRIILQPEHDEEELRAKMQHELETEKMAHLMRTDPHTVEKMRTYMERYGKL